MTGETPDPFDIEWVTFPGGELEAPQPRAVRGRCAQCRASETGRVARRLCFACYRAELERQRQIESVLDRAIAPSEASIEAASDQATRCESDRMKETQEIRGIVRHFHVPPTPADVDPRYAALARRRRQAQLAARRALAEPVVDLEQFPVCWRPFVRIAMNA